MEGKKMSLEERVKEYRENTNADVRLEKHREKKEA
jgi:hypothetical protein